MSLKLNYRKSGCSKLINGVGGWRCPCCNPYRCHPKNMKRLARRRLRRVFNVTLRCTKIF